jgi:hypothetical protein
MANVKISDLTAASGAADANELEINESGTSKKVTGAQISAYVRGQIVTADISDSTVTATELNYVDGVTSPIQTQLDAKVDETGATGSAVLPAGTTAQRDGSPNAGYIRFNSTDSTFEGYDGSAWGSIGGAGGGLFKGENGEVGSSAGDIFRVNEQTLNTDVTIDADENANATGPLIIASGVTLTVTSGGNLSIV